MPEEILGIWVDKQIVMSYVKKTFPLLYGFWLKPIVQVLCDLFILSGHTVIGLLPHLSMIVSIVISVFSIYYIHKDNPWALFYCYFISDVGSFIIALCCSIIPIKFMKYEIKTNDASIEESLI